MINSIYPCVASRTNADKSWPYSEYYIGDRDENMRKDGYGMHHWSGAKSLEYYEGQFAWNTMHGIGEYRCRHRGSHNQAFTYEGHFYNNCMHGYGTMSYADGRVFTGIYYNNLRWGPGIESYACVRENVGLWKGTQLVRLTWKPPTPSVVPDLLSSSKGRNIVALNRCILVTNTKVVGEANPDLKLLIKHGATPLEAAQKLIKLYPRNCTDRKSHLYHADVFDRIYYDTTIETLEPFTNTSRKEDKDKDDYRRTDSTGAPETYKFYAWNNNEMTIHMMKHCYQHDKLRNNNKINLEKILNGPRSSFKPAGQHELDCRTVLMTCYLGHIKHVAQLINEKDVDPNITDIQGNSAIMYAACGNHPDIIHFLFEAGARIDDYNDGCCTPLGAVLMYYVCAFWNIPFSNMLDAILPSSDATISFPGMEQFILTEWKIERDLMNPSIKTSYNKTIKSMQTPIPKKAKSILSSDSLKTNKISRSKEIKYTVSQDGNEELLTEEKQLYLNILSEYNSVVNELYFNAVVKTPIRYLFEVFDMIAEIDAAYSMEDQKKLPDKKDIKAVSKTIKDTVKPSRMLVSSSLEKRLFIDITESIQNEQIEKVLLTIKQLLLDGADPSRFRCPQPALYFAIMSHCPVLVRELVKHGSDVNEVYKESLGYSPLDIAVSGPLTKENLDVIHILLEHGAKAKNSLVINSSVTADTDIIAKEFHGPKLLHAVLSKKITDNDEDVYHQLLELLLDYGCDPIAQYKGRSAVDLAMSKQLEIFNIFIENPYTDLNAVINNSNQTILVKMFYFPYCKAIPVAERVQMLTKLLKFGADPLLKCQNGDQTFDNLFVYVNKILSEIDKTKFVSTSPTKQESKSAKSVIKNKKTEKPKSNTQSTTKPGGKFAGADEISDYKQTVNLVTNSTRLLFKRWIQAQLMKELIQVVDKYKHRHWNMILKEYKTTHTNLWLNPIRCLEIWDILKTTKKRLYKDKRVLKHVLCIVLSYFKKKDTITQELQLTLDEKVSIEKEVAELVREHMIRMKPQAWKRAYVTPELTPSRQISKFNICFECAMPITETKITCGLCKRVDFCSFECMTANIERLNCHPCSDYLKEYLTIRSISKNSSEIVTN